MTDIDLQKTFYIANWRVDPVACRIQADDHIVKLEPRVMSVLLCLAGRAGEVVSREELEAGAWQGMVVGYDALASTIIKLRKAFNDDSRNPHTIETISKRGYRLIAPVRPDADVANPPNTAGGQDEETVTEARREPPSSLRQDERHLAVDINNKNNRLKKALPVAALAILAVIGLGIYLVLRVPVSTAPLSSEQNTQSIAVLPFKNIGKDPQQAYFSEGITTDLIIDLSKLSGLSVIARSSVFSFHEENLDILKVGKELGVNYLLEGSVRRIKDDVRISARLVKAGSGLTLWAERFEGKLDNVFALQDRVIARIVDALSIKLTSVERARLAQKYTSSIEAYDLFLQGWQQFWYMSKESHLQARSLYRKAISIDGRFARAYGNLAMTYAYEYLNGWSSNPAESIRQAVIHAQKAVQLDNTLPQVYWALGLTQIYRQDTQSALTTAQKALSLNPNYADGYGLLATALNYAGKPKQAIKAMDRAMVLNPRYPSIYRVIRGEIYFNNQQYGKAIADFIYALDANPASQGPRLWLAAAYTYAGRPDEANWQLEQVKTINRELTLTRFEQVVPLKDPSQRDHLLNGLYKAGLR